MLVAYHKMHIYYKLLKFFLFNIVQFPCHLVSHYFYTTSLSHRNLLFVQMTHLSNVIHQITQLL